MALTTKLSAAAANAAADVLAAMLNGGSIRIYSGVQATNPDTAIGSQVLLATLTFANPAFASAAGGVATAHALTADSDAAATGTATWCRALTPGGAAVIDGSVGTVADTFNVVLSSVNIVQHMTVAVTSCTLTVA